MFPHGCAIAQVWSELVSIAENSPSQARTHGESKMVALEVECHAPVWFEVCGSCPQVEPWWEWRCWCAPLGVPCIEGDSD